MKVKLVSQSLFYAYFADVLMIQTVSTQNG